MLTTILITGGNGVLGRHLVDKLPTAGYKVIATKLESEQPKNNQVNFVLDVTDRASFYNLPKDVDIVIHMAAVSRVAIAESNPSLCLNVNVGGTINLVEWCLSLNKLPFLVFISSREVYGESLYTPVDENHPTNPKSVYGISKLMAEMILDNRKLYSLRYAIIRLTNVYGSTHDYHTRAIPSFVINALKGKTLTIYGGDQILDFLHLNDFLEGFIRLIGICENDIDRINRAKINICSGKGHSLIEIAKLIITKTKSSSSINIEKARPYEVRRFIGDYRKAQLLIGFTPRIELSDGLEDYIKKMEDLI
jgi:nucleoside-diphosphate-sugar epimerase